MLSGILSLIWGIIMLGVEVILMIFSLIMAVVGELLLGWVGTSMAIMPEFQTSVARGLMHVGIALVEFGIAVIFLTLLRYFCNKIMPWGRTDVQK